jgi:hypothetical protein
MQIVWKCAWDNIRASALFTLKRQKAAALHDLSAIPAVYGTREASWSAAVPDRKVLCRFCMTLASAVL